MSNVNIKRAVGNIRSNTTVYTPIVETIVNSIEAIEAKGDYKGKITVTANRSSQDEVDGALPKVVGIKVHDTGIGFTDENRESFDTLYSDYKLKQGGKGFGRFTCLKYFEEMHVDSVYWDGKFKRRTFSMGTGKEIIVNEKITESNAVASFTEITLVSETTGSLNHKLSTIARSLVEMLLPYFITKDYICPRISLEEADGSSSIILNDYIGKANSVIREIILPLSSFSIAGKHGLQLFEIRAFKIFSPRNKVSKISLVAHKREVTESPIHFYIPEFADEFYEKSATGDDNKDRNYIIKSYVFSKYLDDTVSLERGAFEFQRESDLVHGISQTDIERRVAALTKAAVQHEVTSRQERKSARIESYIENDAPWHRSIYKDLDLSTVPTNASDSDIEAMLQQEKFRLDSQIRREVAALLQIEDPEGIFSGVSKIASKISESSKNDLVHYVALRRKVLDLFRKTLEIKESGKYSSECAVHDIIFPTKTDSLTAAYHDHNLWIIDERLNFTRYISSDLPLNGGKTERPDLLIYNRRVAFRADNESSNPVTIFEFKKPHRDDFVNPSSKEDPVQQIVRYVNSIRNGKYKTPTGRKINVEANTPFYGYVICELSTKVEEWLRTEKDFKPMPDRLGWFRWFENINLYIEVISWDKLLKDADMRNKVFFEKLGI